MGESIAKEDCALAESSFCGYGGYGEFDKETAIGIEAWSITVVPNLPSFSGYISAKWRKLKSVTAGENINLTLFADWALTGSFAVRGITAGIDVNMEYKGELEGVCTFQGIGELPPLPPRLSKEGEYHGGK